MGLLCTAASNESRKPCQVEGSSEKIGRFCFGRQHTGSLLVELSGASRIEVGVSPETGGVGTNSVVCTSNGRIEACDLCSRKCVSQVILSGSSS